MMFDDSIVLECVFGLILATKFVTKGQFHCETHAKSHIMTRYDKSWFFSARSWRAHNTQLVEVCTRSLLALLPPSQPLPSLSLWGLEGLLALAEQRHNKSCPRLVVAEIFQPVEQGGGSHELSRKRRKRLARAVREFVCGGLCKL